MGLNILGYGVKTQANPSTAVPLTSGEVYVLPAGQYMICPGAYTFMQWFDPVTQLWRCFGTPSGSDSAPATSDGTNFRLANLTGTVVGASVTNAGSGYTNGIYFPTAALLAQSGNQVNGFVGTGIASAPTCTFAAGGGTVLAQGTVIVGGAINSTIAITSGGSSYTLPPTLIISNPPSGGVPATATCTISAGAINAVTVTNQGAGYNAAPTVTVVRHPLDTTGTGGVLTVNATLAGSGGITAITVPINGVGMTSVPAITFAPASTSAATSIMCFTITTGVAQTSASNMGTGNIGFACGALATAQSINTNPAITTGLFLPRVAYTAFNTTASGGITFVDGGLHQIIPTGIAYSVLSNGTISAASTAVAQTVGGASDISYVVAI